MEKEYRSKSGRKITTSPSGDGTETWFQIYPALAEATRRRSIAITNEAAIDLAVELLRRLAPEKLVPESFEPGDYVQDWGYGASNPQVWRLVQRHYPAGLDEGGGEWWMAEYNINGKIDRGYIQVDRLGSDFRRTQVEVTPATPEKWTVVE